MSMTAVTEKLEPQLGIPILGINATILWYALRENGFSAPVQHAGRLLREFWGLTSATSRYMLNDPKAPNPARERKP